MDTNPHASTSYTSSSISRTSAHYNNATAPRPLTGWSNARPGTSRPRTGISAINNQDIVCAITESRGVSPTVGIALLNLYTAEAFLCQISDNQSYVRTIQKLSVYEPSKILVPAFATNAVSKLHACIDENLGHISAIEEISRRYFAETTGHEYIKQLAFAEDIEAIQISIGSNYFSVCCFAAVMKYVEVRHETKFPLHSLRVTYQPSEGSVMIDVSTTHSLELIQNIESAKSKQCLFGLLDESLTPMGARYLRTNILQPSTDADKINARLDAVEELSSNEDLFWAIRKALKSFIDAEKILTDLITIPKTLTPWYRQQSVNRVMMLKQFVNMVPPVHEALTGSRSELLVKIRENVAPDNIQPVRELINAIVNENITFAKSPLELRQQRNYAVKSGIDGMLDIARQAFKEAQDDAYEHVKQLSTEHILAAEMKFEHGRQFYIRIPAYELEDRPLPAMFTNAIKKKGNVECQTLDLIKFNQKIRDCEIEILQQCEITVNELIDSIRQHMSSLYKCCESIALLDMRRVRNMINDTLGVKNGRHPIREKFHQPQRFIPNDIYATPQTRFQVITGCNMSGKSTYIRSIALISIMAQIGSFVPATRAYMPIMRQLFARTSVDDSIEANVSTFAAEMREMAFILRNIDSKSLVIVDELGRGTSTRDGLAIAIAISETLIESKALVWFATHFKDLATILSERSGVVNMHMSVDMTHDQTSISMLYRISEGLVKDTHYGLALARVYPLPKSVLDVAAHVSTALESSVKRRKKTSMAVVRERKRRLLLNLKEHLEQARSGSLEGEALKAWLMELQREFVHRMTAIETESTEAQDAGERGDVEMGQGEGEGSGENGSRAERRDDDVCMLT